MMEWLVHCLAPISSNLSALTPLSLILDDVFLKNDLKISMMMLKAFFTFEKLAINNNSIIPRVIH